MIATLVQRARNDQSALDEQHAAFCDLVRHFQRMAFFVALRMLNDVGEAEDATQEAFLTAWLKLRRLREPAAFGSWLKRLVRTQCSRRLRKRTNPTREPRIIDDNDARERQRLIARSMASLTASEHRAIVLFYFLGCTLKEIASLLRIPTTTAGKRLYTARLKLRRSLPHALRNEFIRRRPASEFARRVRRGLFDQYVGRYRFDRRPSLVVQIERRDDQLISLAGGQCHILASIDDEALITAAYDGEGRFRRNRNGRITHFIYYEFGKRLGIARKIR
jgi:RNA polymerase sigma-70 factor (ECF subfamily)